MGYCDITDSIAMASNLTILSHSTRPAPPSIADIRWPAHQIY